MIKAYGEREWKRRLSGPKKRRTPYGGGGNLDLNEFPELLGSERMSQGNFIKEPKTPRSMGRR